MLNIRNVQEILQIHEYNTKQLNRKKIKSYLWVISLKNSINIQSLYERVFNLARIHTNAI